MTRTEQDAAFRIFCELQRHGPEIGYGGGSEFHRRVGAWRFSGPPPTRARQIVIQFRDGDRWAWVGRPGQGFAEHGKRGRIRVRPGRQWPERLAAAAVLEAAR